jgi:hypothetical protein
MANGIDIVIGAEVSGALQGLQKVEAATVKAGCDYKQITGKSLQLLGRTQSLGRLSCGFAGVQKANEATALINLSRRVAQDAPYGLLVLPITLTHYLNHSKD